MKKPKPYHDEIVAIKGRIRAEQKREAGEIRKWKYYFMLACDYTRPHWSALKNAEQEYTTRFYVAPDCEWDDGGRSYYESWRIHLSQDVTSANVKRFETLEEAVRWSHNLPFKTEVVWRSK